MSPNNDQCSGRAGLCDNTIPGKTQHTPQLGSSRQNQVWPPTQVQLGEPLRFGGLITGMWVIKGYRSGDDSKQLYHQTQQLTKAGSLDLTAQAAHGLESVLSRCFSQSKPLPGSSLVSACCRQLVWSQGILCGLSCLRAFLAIGLI